MLENMPVWGVVTLAILFILLFGSIIARCEHQPDNTEGFIVHKQKTYNALLSEYEVLEPGLLGSRMVIVDTTGKFSVGDTLVLVKN